MLTRFDVPHINRAMPKPVINRKIRTMSYSIEMLGALLGIDKEILRVGYDPMRHALNLYIYDPLMQEEDERYEGLEPELQVYLPDHILAADTGWEAAEDV